MLARVDEPSPQCGEREWAATCGCRTKDLDPYLLVEIVDLDRVDPERAD